jgi:hypothetical protein
VAYIIDKWIPTQSWSNGIVGMNSGSYRAVIQLLASGQVERDASGEPVHLKAIMPASAFADCYRDITMQGGNINIEFVPLYLIAVEAQACILQPLITGDDAIKIIKEHRGNVSEHVNWFTDPANGLDNIWYEERSPKIYWPDKPEGGWDAAEGVNTIPSGLSVMLLNGWFDMFERGSIDNYTYGLKNQKPGDKAMIIGEWYHINVADVPALGIPGFVNRNIHRRWFDWKLKGKKDALFTEFPVFIYVMGEDRWRMEKDWPLPESRVKNKTFYLSKKKASSIKDDWFSKLNKSNNYSLVSGSTYEDYSTKNPVLDHTPPFLHGLLSRSFNRWAMGLFSKSAVEAKFLESNDLAAKAIWDDERQDELGVLTFTTEPLEEDLEITGPLTLTFWASTKFGKAGKTASSAVISMIKDILGVDENLILDLMDKEEVQWVVELNDVFDQGRARNITSGWLAASRRPYDPANPNESDPDYKPFDPFYTYPSKHPDMIKANEVYKYIVELWPTDNVFKKGHRVRISISASDFPHLLPVLVPSDNTIILDPDHQAKLDFKVTNSNDEGKTWNWVSRTKTSIVADGKALSDYLVNHVDKEAQVEDEVTGEVSGDAESGSSSGTLCFIRASLG